VEVILGRCSRITRSWRVINGEEVPGKLEEWALHLEVRSAEPARLAWSQQTEEPRPDDDVGVLHQGENITLNSDH
jgi:hypothetical protein